MMSIGPSSQPSVQPPSGGTRSQPTCTPTSQPMSHPASHSTSQPTSHPTSQPTSQPSPFDFHFQLLLAGDSAVGKTHLLHRFVDSTHTDSYIPRTGLDYKPKTIELDGKKIKLSIWDTPGQDRFLSSSSPIYKTTHGFILVYDITDVSSFNSVSQWLRDIAKYSSGDAAILLVGNKSDNAKRREVSFEQGQAFAHSRGLPFVETSATRLENVEDAFMIVISQIYEKLKSQPKQPKKSELKPRSTQNNHKILSQSEIQKKSSAQATLAIEEAIRAGGSVPLNRCKVFVVGPGRHGKTSLINNLMRRPFEEDCVSTAGAVQEDVSCSTDLLVALESRQSNKWTSRKAPEKELEEALGRVVLNSQKKVSKVGIATASLPVSTDHSFNQVSATNASASHVTSTSFLSAAKSFFVSKPKSPLLDYDKDLVMKQIEGSVHTASDLTLSLVDFGGQSVFNVIHHLFFRSQAVYIMVFNMELLANPSTRESCLMSLKSWLNSITVHTLNASSKLTASIAIVGTRGDKIRSQTQWDSLSETLRTQFGHTDAWNNVISNSAKPSLHFFPVNNLLGWKDSGVENLVNSLEQRMLHDKNCSFVTAPYPLLWLKCLDRMLAMKRDVVSLVELKVMAATFGVNGDTFENMLTYFHDAGNCLWIQQEGLREWVVLDVFRLLVTPAAAVICCLSSADKQVALHERRVHRMCKAQYGEDWDEYLSGGILSQRVLRYLLSEMLEQDDVKVDIVSQLMIKYGLIVDCLSVSYQELQSESSINSKAVKYCVPAMLPAQLIPVNSQKDGNWLEGVYSSCLLSFSVSDTWGVNTVLTREHLIRHGFLPAGLFERLVGKALGVSYALNPHCQCQLSLNDCRFWFGKQRFRLLLVEELHAIRLDVEGVKAVAVHASIMDQLAVVISECLGCLKVISLAAGLSKITQHPIRIHCCAKFLVIEQLQRVASCSNDGRVVDVSAEGGELLLNAEAIRATFSAWMADSGDLNKLVFLSYRWGEFDSIIVKDIYQLLTTRYTVGKDFRGVNVFLDRETIPNAVDFKECFASYLLSCRVVVPIVSAAACARLVSFYDKEADNVLAEWILASESFLADASSSVKRVYPVLLGNFDAVHQTHNSFFSAEAAPRNANAARATEPPVLLKDCISTVVPLKTIRFVKEMLLKFAPDVHAKMTAELRDETLTVKGVVERMLAFNAFNGKGFSVPRSLTHAVVGPLMGIVEEADALPTEVSLNSNLLSAFEIVTLPENAIDSIALRHFLTVEGISSATDLGAVTEDEVLRLSVFLKKLPRRRFFEAMGRVMPVDIKESYFSSRKIYFALFWIVATLVVLVVAAVVSGTLIETSS